MDNICELIDEIQRVCDSKKIVCKSVQNKLKELGLYYIQLGTYSKLKFRNNCNLIYINKGEFLSNKKYRSKLYLNTGYYIVVGTVSQFTEDNVIHCGWYKELTEEEVITLTLFDYKFIKLVKR